MPVIKNTTGQGIYLYEYDITNKVPKTGDSANITGSYTLDGTDHAGFTTANPTEIGGGVYWQPLATGETNGNAISYRWASSSAGCQISPVFVLTEAAAMTTAGIATAIWEDTLAGGDFGTAGSIGLLLKTAIPNAVAGAAGGIFIAGTNAATTITTSLTTHIIGTVDTVTTVTNQLTAAQIATGVWQDATGSDFTTASSIGKCLYIANVIPGAAGGHFIAGTNAATTITTGLTTHFIGTLDTLTTYTGNTPQTGDCYARLGAPAGASIAADLAEIEAETDGIAAIPTSSAPTVAQIATAIWEDTTAGGDFGTAGSIGLLLATDIDAKISTRNATTPPTVAQIATAIWEDTTAGGDFGTAGSIGLLLATDINATISSRNATTPPTVAQIAAAVWKDTTAGGDFGTAGSIGLLIVTTGLTVASVTGAVGSVTGNVGGSVASVTAPVSVLLTQTLSAARDVSAVVDTSLTLNDAFHCAIGAEAGKETVVSTTYTVMTPHGTTLRIFTLDSGTAPTSRT